MNGMLRDERRRSPSAAEALRWIAADARDVACIDHGADRPRVDVQTVARGLRPWQRRVERRRLVALLRRCAIVGIIVASVLQIGALASGSRGPGVWLVPALAAAALAPDARPDAPYDGRGRRAPARSRSRARRGGEHRARAGDLARRRRRSVGARRARGRRRPAARSRRVSRGPALVSRRGTARSRCLRCSSRGWRCCCSCRARGRQSAARVAAAGKAHVRVVPPSRRALRAENGLAATADPVLRCRGSSRRRSTRHRWPLCRRAERRGRGARRRVTVPTAEESRTTRQPARCSRPPARSGNPGPCRERRTPAAAPRPRPPRDRDRSPTARPARAHRIPLPADPARRARPGAASVAPVQRGRPTGSAPGGSTPGSASRNGGQSKGGTGSSAPGTAPGRKPGKSAAGRRDCGHDERRPEPGQGRRAAARRIAQRPAARTGLRGGPRLEGRNERACVVDRRPRWRRGSQRPGDRRRGRQRQAGRSAIRAPGRRGCGVHRSRRRARLLRLLRPRERKRLVT